MNADADLAELARLSGLLPQYVDMQKRVRVSSPDTQRSLLAALGVAAENAAIVRETLAQIKAHQKERNFPEEIIIESGVRTELEFASDRGWRLISEDTREEVCTDRASGTVALPALQSGIYQLNVRSTHGAETVRVLAAPRRLVSVETLTGASRIWGINLALYGLLSERNCGLGDYQNLADFAALTAGTGAAFVGVNPLHSMGYSGSAISPYSPSHRGYLNIEHIALDRVPGLERAPAMLKLLEDNSILCAQLRAQNEVPYQQHKVFLRRILNAAFPIFLKEADATHQADFAAFVANGGADLERFARYEALGELHGDDWRQWPSGMRKTPNTERMFFHQWLQWVADSQLRIASHTARDSGLSLGLYLDLAVGPRRGGAESWCEQSCVAQNVSIGAPPDHLSPEGQNWDLAAFAPQKLQQANYQPLRRILAQTMRHAGVIRIDHVLGLARSFLIPDDGAPGGYVSQPLESLIAVIKIEAERNTCAVIGEDLGLVPDRFRDTMRTHGFYGYSVLQYEDLGKAKDLTHKNVDVLSCFATHDTPTVRGYEQGRDIEWWHRLGWIDGETMAQAKKKRAGDVSRIMCKAQQASDFQSSVLAILAESPARMVSIQFDDILGATEAQNLPGTIDEHPNWRRKSSIWLEDLSRFRPLKEVAAAMASTRSIQKEDVRNEVSNR